jgi:hypothetical protein
MKNRIITLFMGISILCSCHEEEKQGLNPAPSKDFSYIYDETTYVAYDKKEYNVKPVMTSAYIVYHADMAAVIDSLIEVNGIKYEKDPFGVGHYRGFAYVPPVELRNVLCGTLTGENLGSILNLAPKLIYYSPNYMIVQNGQQLADYANFVLFEIDKEKHDIKLIKSFCEEHNSIFIGMSSYEYISNYGMIACTIETGMTALQFAYLLYKSGLVETASCTSLAVVEPA